MSNKKITDVGHGPNHDLRVVVGDVVTVAECKATVSGPSIVIGEGERVVMFDSVSVRVVPGTANIAIGGEAATHYSSALPKDGGWFHYVSFFIPKSISEPWLGDLREHRIKMADEGFSRTAIDRATVVEITLLILNWVIDKVLYILTPFKR